MLLTPPGKYYLDSKDVNSLADLRRALQTYESVEGSLFGIEQKPKPSWQQSSKSANNCFKCGKPDHRAADCRSSADSNQQAEQHQPKCFSCGIFGHKSPDCPSKVQGKKEPTKQGKEKDSKKALKTNRVSVTESETTDDQLMATVAGNTIPVSLNTGAQISILLEEAVPQSSCTGIKVRVKGNVGM